jgi:hypothetical protein
LAEINLTQPVKRVTLQAVVTKCGCGNPEGHAGQVCPSPKKTEDLGTIADSEKRAGLFGHVAFDGVRGWIKKG